MENQKIAALSFMAFSIVFGTTMFLISPIEATGGAGEIKGLIDPIIERAIEALQNNNTELALEEIETLKNELDDTFETDKD